MPSRHIVGFELPPPQISSDEARRTADEVLSGRGYVEAARGPSLRERVVDWIFDRVSEVFGSLSSFGGRGLFAWIIIGLFAVGIVFLLSRLVQNLGPLPVRDGAPDPTTTVTKELSAAEWRAKASEAESTGDWRSGLRCRHRALVTELIDRDAVSARPGQTAGEIERGVVARASSASAPMREATWLFNYVWYGGLETGAAERDRFELLADQVLRSLSHVGTAETPLAVPS